MPDDPEPPLDSDATIPMAAPTPMAGAKEPHDLPLPEELAKLLPKGDYSVEGFLGQGGMGAVYRGTQVRLQRPVAIKIMRRDQGKDYGFEERFRREALALAKLNHPNIVSVIDYGEAGPEFLYIVMEFVDGADLVGVIRSGQMTQEMALKLLPQICDALQFAHDNGIVHRDIKPANILLTRDGRIKMADFGLAKRFDVTSSFHTQTGTGMGTPDYAAPEQFDPNGTVDHRADIYALGVMIYQMITGHLPRGAWKPPSEKADVDAHWDQIVSHALQTDPHERYSSVTEIKTDISSIPLPVGGSSQHRALASAATQASTSVRTQAGGRSTRIQASVATPKSKMPLILGFVGVAVVIAAGAFFALRKPGDGRAASPKPPSGGALGQSALPATATKAAPCMNTLGMKFVPVPITGGPTNGQRVLFSMWDTRVQDYEVFVKETQHEWPKADFEQGSLHPAVNVSWDDAQAFCQWLTERERKAGKLGASERYRLPSDHEWSCAVEIGAQEDAAKLPMEKSLKLVDVFPWGSAWPPPKDAGNYAGEELQPVLAAGKFNFIKGLIAGYSDGFVNTSPVGSFPKNRFGLYDMSGNVWQWCEDWYDKGQKYRVLRGGSWAGNDRGYLLSCNRGYNMPDARSRSFNGFRCVLEATAK